MLLPGTITGIIFESLYPSKDEHRYPIAIIIGVFGSFIGAVIGDFLKIGSIGISFINIWTIGGSIVFLLCTKLGETRE